MCSISRKNFYKVQSILGPTDKNDTLVSITIRLKGKADWITANNVANGYEFRVSRKFWGRRSRYRNFLWCLLLRAVESGTKTTYTLLFVSAT